MHHFLFSLHLPISNLISHFPVLTFGAILHHCTGLAFLECNNAYIDNVLHVHVHVYHDNLYVICIQYYGINFHMVHNWNDTLWVQISMSRTQALDSRLSVITQHECIKTGKLGTSST